MNKKVTKLAQAHDTQAIDFDWAGIEGEFNHQHTIAKGTAGLLFRASEEDGYLCNTHLNGAAYSIEHAIEKMLAMFEALSIELFNQVKMGEMGQASDDEYHDQFALANSTAGLLSYITTDVNHSQNSEYINTAAYSLESAIHEMNKIFKAFLNEYLNFIKKSRVASS